MKNAPRHFHFLGICGTAMGAVAVALRERKFVVSGSDENVYPPMSTFRRSAGSSLHAGYRPENIPADADVVVIGNAMKRGNPEVEAVLNRKLFYLSLPEVLKNYFLRGKHNLVVTGTHGKTTTTAVLAWIMETGGRNPGYLIGGIPKNFGQGARLNDSKYFVIEGDEYDSAFFDKRSKFIHYLPELRDREQHRVRSRRHLQQPRRDQAELSTVAQHRAAKRHGPAQRRRSQLRRSCERLPRPNDRSRFFEKLRGTDSRRRLIRPKARDSNSATTFFEIPLVGEFNVRNAAMAATAARFYGVSKAKIDTALKSFFRELRDDRKCAVKRAASK